MPGDGILVRSILIEGVYKNCKISVFCQESSERQRNLRRAVDREAGFVQIKKDAAVVMIGIAVCAGGEQIRPAILTGGGIKCMADGVRHLETDQIITLLIIEANREKLLPGGIRRQALRVLGKGGRGQQQAQAETQEQCEGFAKRRFHGVFLQSSVISGKKPTFYISIIAYFSEKNNSSLGRLSGGAVRKTGGYAQPKTESRKPAAMAEPMTPATLGPMACISR